MARLLCFVCQSIFRGKKIEHPRGQDLYIYTPHHQSLEELHDGMSVGCVLCVQLACHLASEVYDRENLESLNSGRSLRLQFAWSLASQVDDLKNLEALKSGRILHDYDRPGKISFCVQLKERNTKDHWFYRFFTFGAVPLSSATKPQQLCRPISVCSNSESTFQLIQTWLDNCRLSHQRCCQRGKDTLDFRYPTRLIDTGSAESEKCRLIETGSVLISGAYITLSHRWDFSDFLKLKSETMKTLKGGLLICDLPATFRDAIFVAQQLGIRYLWIDSLCIQQDCREDWVKESPTMRHVYGFATLNIVAGHSHGPGDGLFNARESSKFDPIVVRSNWDDNINTDYLLWDKLALDLEFEFAPLTNRGWVFQERLLAPRILQFGENQVYWRCSQLFACETWPQGVCSFEGNPLRFGADLDGLDGDARMQIPSLKDSTDIPIVFLSKGPVAQWERLVAEYSRTKLTRSEDRLVALSGVAKLFQQTFADDYLAGLWRKPLERLLCWCRDEAEQSHPRERPEYRAPSWSWASINGPICFTTTTREHKLHWLEYVIRVLDAQVTPLNGDKMAQVRSGYVKVEARLHSLQLTSGKLEDASPGRPNDVRVKMDGKEAFGFSSIIDTEPDCELNGLLLWVMPTLVVVETALESFLKLSIEGLVLRKRSERGVESDTYERIGYFSFYSTHGEAEEIFGICVEPDDYELHVDARCYSLEFDSTIRSWEIVTIV